MAPEPGGVLNTELADGITESRDPTQMSALNSTDAPAGGASAEKPALEQKATETAAEKPGEKLTKIKDIAVGTLQNHGANTGAFTTFQSGSQTFAGALSEQEKEQTAKKSAADEEKTKLEEAYRAVLRAAGRRSTTQTPMAIATTRAEDQADVAEIQAAAVAAAENSDEPKPALQNAVDRTDEASPAAQTSASAESSSGSQPALQNAVDRSAAAKPASPEPGSAESGVASKPAVDTANDRAKEQESAAAEDAATAATEAGGQNAPPAAPAAQPDAPKDGSFKWPNPLENQTVATLTSAGDFATNVVGSLANINVPALPFASVLTAVSGGGAFNTFSSSDDAPKTMEEALKAGKKPDKPKELSDSEKLVIVAETINERLGEMMSAQDISDEAKPAAASKLSNVLTAEFLRPLAEELGRLVREAAANEYSRRGWY